MLARERTLLQASAIILGIAFSTAASAQNLVTNGDLDANAVGWSAIPLPAGVSGPVTLTHDPEDALGFPTSGSLRLDWNLSNPAGDFAIVRVAQSACIPTPDPTEIFVWGHAGRSVAIVSGDFRDLSFCQYTTPTCTGAFICGTVPVNFSTSFSFSPVFSQSLQPTTQSIQFVFDVDMALARGGGNVGQATYLFDKLFIQSSTLPPAPLTAEAALLNLSGLAADFEGQTTGGSSPFPLLYTWDFGDSSTSTSQNPSHAYAAAGIYTVTLTVDSGFEQATDELLVVVGGVPTQEVPTLSAVGFAVLMVLLTLAALTILRRSQSR